MNEWLLAAFAFIAGLAPCAFICVRASLGEALVALNLSGVLGVLALMALAEGVDREPLIDLAVVLAVVTFTGSVAYARFLEREPAEKGGG